VKKNEIKIIIVDDSDFSRNVISQYLIEEGYDVIGEAANAKEALQLLKDRAPHIMLIDIVMPEISGIELAQTIQDNFNNINIIMMSSLSGENIIIESISAGASDFVQKPFTKDMLVNSINKISESLEG
jgi:two-component system chemotaxis response regulator CheY